MPPITRAALRSRTQRTQLAAQRAILATPTIQATGEHTYGEWKVVKEATKTAKGEKQRTCSLCGHVDSEEIPILSDIPATGDDSNIMLWGGTMVISLAALVVLLVESKKRRTAK